MERKVAVLGEGLGMEGMVFLYWLRKVVTSKPSSVSSSLSNKRNGPRACSLLLTYLLVTCW